MDLDNDGVIDLISGSWPGEIFFFKGISAGTFAAPVKLCDRYGKPINVGGGVQKESDGAITITGDATFEHTPEGTFVVYNGERFKSTAATPVAVTGCASAVYAVDWNGDGKLDLLVGEIHGLVYMLPNDSVEGKLTFGRKVALRAGGATIRVPGGDAGPHACDWDGDGKVDLLVGAGDGSVTWFRNVGTNAAPELAAGVVLVPAAAEAFAPKKTARPGVRTKVCTYDWNGDGLLDLLVGDFSMEAPDVPEPTPAEREKHLELRKEREELNARYRQLIGKLHGPEREKNEDKLKEVHLELAKLRKRWSEIAEQLPKESETHGYVWLYLRLKEDKRLPEN